MRVNWKKFILGAFIGILLGGGLILFCEHNVFATEYHPVDRTMSWIGYSPTAQLETLQAENAMLKQVAMTRFWIALGCFLALFAVLYTYNRTRVNNQVRKILSRRGGIAERLAGADRSAG